MSWNRTNIKRLSETYVYLNFIGVSVQTLMITVQSVEDLDVEVNVGEV